MSSPIQKVAAGKIALIGSKLLNRLIKSANEWENLEVEETTDPDAVSKITRGEARTVLTIKTGGVGLPAGYTFEEFTICVNGAPETRWWPTWPSDPS